MTVVVVVCRETFEQQRMDIRALQREFNSNKKALEPKVRKVLALYTVHVDSVLKQSNGTCTLPCNGSVYHYHWQEWKLMALVSCRAKTGTVHCGHGCYCLMLTGEDAVQAGEGHSVDTESARSPAGRARD